MVDAATILPVLLDRVETLEAAPAKYASDGASQHLKHVLERLPKAVAARRGRPQGLGGRDFGVVRPRRTRCQGCAGDGAGHHRPSPHVVRQCPTLQRL